MAKFRAYQEMQSRRLPSPSCNVDETKPFTIEKLVQLSREGDEIIEMNKLDNE